MKASSALLCLSFLVLANLSNQRSINILNDDNSPQEWRLKQIFAKAFNLNDDGGGVSCIACTAVVGLIEQLSVVQNKTTDEVMDMLCDWLPSDLQPECDVLVDTYGEFVLVMLENEETADTVCNELDICTNSTCHLWPLSDTPPRSYEVPDSVRNFKRPQNLPTWVWPWDQVIDHKPFWDADGDLFSTMQELRGWSWRGGDCNDQNADIYAGRKETKYGPNIDHNCNGIFGADKNGTSWEDLLCSGTPQFGTVVLGDSASAHFHIPPAWMTAKLMNEEIFSNLLEIAENEMDFPMMSSATGFMNLTWEGTPVGPVDSAYLRNRARNLCSHRDYQNIAVNGARSGAMLSNIITTMARNQTLDYPLFISYALIGNDVCNGHYGTSHMTTPDEFYQNVLGALEYLDQVLPSGSHVSLIGLVDGRILYDTMGERIHPIGMLYQNVKYKDMYDFLNCLGVSPCFGWMNSDAYWRNATTARAEELNQVYQELVANNTFKNFDVHYFDCPMKKVIEVWNGEGGQTYELIEPIDGFHPTQLTNALMTEVMYGQYEALGILPPINPNNDLIRAMFGDQGGYDPESPSKRPKGHK
eukprot:TRINITY_DN4967_c0_g1_i1.p1 TRINITY_DN4967_c0_g1~~TRINITY_DN4967_c0_g1_i1.p1  ORF type:complete len:585 (-),score=119.82 TRINITY_DN4967_c0_g1_i1:4-1758(-)